MTDRKKRLFRLVLAAGFAPAPVVFTVVVAFVLDISIAGRLGGPNRAAVVLMTSYTVLLFALFEQLSVGYTLRSLFTDVE